MNPGLGWRRRLILMEYGQLLRVLYCLVAIMERFEYIDKDR